MYAFKTDLPSGIIEIVISGFWQDDEVGTFKAALAREVASIRATGRQQATLYDYTDATIQSQHTVAQLAELARDNPMRARKSAIYTGGRLARRQATRIADLGAHIRMFDDRAEALDWLRH